MQGEEAEAGGRQQRLRAHDDAVMGVVTAAGLQNGGFAVAGHLVLDGFPIGVVGHAERIHHMIGARVALPVANGDGSPFTRPMTAWKGPGL